VGAAMMGPTGRAYARPASHSARVLRFASCTVLCASLTFLSGLDARAQDTAAQADARATISGVVTDSAGRPVENAFVYVSQPQRSVRTGSDGKFRLVALKPGKYTVGVRSLGFREASAKVTVKAEGASVSIVLERTAFSLPSMITTAARGGLSGVVADTGMRPLTGVSVRVIGEPVMLTTDSAGAFFAPLKPGRYLVRIDQKGFARQVVGVTIPDSVGRQMAVWMVPSRSRPNPVVGANLFDMHQRVIRATPVFSGFYSREDLERLGHRDVQSLTRTLVGARLNTSCRVVVNGGPRTEPVWRLQTWEIEFVEIYLTRPERAVTRPNGAPRDAVLEQRLARASSPKDDCGASIYVWIRE